MVDKRWVLLVASEVGRTDSVSDRAMERLVEAIGDEGYEAVRTTSPEDGLSLCWTGTSKPTHSLRSAPLWTSSAAFVIATKKSPSSSSRTARWSPSFRWK
jgi:hypothetical protein